jgi:Tfp pilus assembly protein PilV
MIDQKTPPVEAAVSAAILTPAQGNRLCEASSWQARPPLQRRGAAGFTLAELLVSVGVLVVLVLFFGQVLKSTATITTLGHKQMDADSQARQLLDRMAVDFAQMIKRSDVNYYWKGGTGGTQPGNDQMAFYSAVPGYYSTTTSTTQSPISLIGYRVNANKAERLGKGLLWNGVNPIEAPLVFWQAIAAPTNADYSASGEIIGPQIFRFEYCYLATDGTLSITPPSVTGMAAIIVDIAVIDPKSKVLLTDANVATFNTFGAVNFLSDYAANMVPGQLRKQWQDTVNNARDPITNAPLPPSALSGIRLYERYFYLSSPTP